MTGLASVSPWEGEAGRGPLEAVGPVKGLRRWPRAWGGGAGGTGRGSSSGSRASAASLCTRPGLCPLGAAIPTWGAEAEQRRIMSSAGREPDGMQGAMSARRARAPWGRAVGRSQSKARQAWSRKGPGEGARAGLSRVRLRDGRKSVHCGWKERREGRGGRGLEERENGSRVTLRPPALGTAGQRA